MDNHDRAVAQIATSISKFHSRKEAFRIYHGSTNSTRQSQYQRDKMVDTSRLNRVLKVDEESKTVLVEPNVPMDALVEATLKHGLIPPVVMEFPGITVGGGFAGTAGESSSFRYGFFDRTINWIEMVLANGEIVKASPAERTDLFYGVASSFGTLGVTTLLEVQLIEAKAYVALAYHPVSSVSEAQKGIEKATNDPTCDYLDGIMYSETKGVVCAGRLTNDIGIHVSVQKFTRPSDPWFYTHVQKITKDLTSPVTEAIPIVDYLFRYDRGGFWVARYAYKYFLTPFNRITRYLLDDHMHTRVMYHALHQSGLSSQYIIQDVAIPYTQTSTFMSYLDTNFKHYPIWLCPLKQSGKGIASTHSLQADKLNAQLPEFMLNFGVWGPGPKNRDKFVAWNRDFERKVHELGGQKWLYAHTFYTEAEFDEIYNRKEYDALREKYHATYLPSVYDKVKVDVEKEKQKVVYESWRDWLRASAKKIWPLQGLYGVYSAWRRDEYLLPRTERKSGKIE
ncbi:related to 24-dehydrocholesterol reductase precursor [Phialocephala subalpina]|uniref:Delta(24)-sterol reductase n=1 Tax=Phialocephala subalpina TaxID=576137 RepID=A0A1L7XFW3_9HELO|nr:related to 24-dehydrocholesterol reductase precursor [Phialocephala subalpina]